jgi:ribosomal protein RSM22 (predicted rRNA methylase)
VTQVGRAQVEAAAQRLSAAYRAKGAVAARAARTEADVAAYLAVRAPATYAACIFVLARLAEQRPDWRPRSVLDVGAGPGVATWAARTVWPSVEQATLVEVEPEMIRAGRALLPDARWLQGDAASGDERAELVLVSYVLNELREHEVPVLAGTLWRRTEDTIVFVEPGTPEGYGRVLAARDAVLEAGDFTIAPCPHDRACPLPPGDWCHFAVRLPRSEAHRAVKAVARGFEDEKLSYAALSRTREPRARSRVIRQPELHSGHVYLDLCESEGLRRATVTRRDKADYRRARKIAWGDAWELEG